MINSTITAITYSEALTMLDVSYMTIRNAIKRGVLTRLPSVGLEQKLIKEQVELFKDKTQLRKDLLSSEELRIWQEYNDLVENSKLTTIVSNHINEEKKTSPTDITSLSFSNAAWVIVAIIIIAISANWYIKHKPEIDEKIIEISDNIKEINEQTRESMIQSLKKLGNNPDANMVINTVKQVA